MSMIIFYLQMIKVFIFLNCFIILSIIYYASLIHINLFKYFHKLEKGFNITKACVTLDILFSKQKAKGIFKELKSNKILIIIITHS